MTKFEEEVDKVAKQAGYESLSLLIGDCEEANKIYIHFKNWHSDEEFQEKATKLTFAEEEIEELGDKIGQLKSQLQQQALPVVPEDVAKLPPFDDMKEYVLDERLLTIREFLNKLDEKSNSDITEAEAWCMIHEDIAYRAMLDGYTVEKPQLFYIELPNVYGLSDSVFVSKVENGTILEFTKGKDYALAFTEQEIKSIDERYWQFAVPVEDGE